MKLPLVQQARRGVPGSPRLRAFTLVELLTVVAIIGVLATITVVAVGKVRETARGAQCSSNMRAIGIAILSYAGDNRKATPSALAAGALNSGQPASWYLQISPYLGADLTSVDKTRRALRTLVCSSSVRSASGELDVPWSAFNNAHWPFISDYGINYSMNNPSYARGIMLTRIDQPRNPANTPLLAEMVYQNNFVAVTFTSAQPASDEAAYDAGQNQRFSQRHGGGSNMLFFDGHVERLAYAEIAARASRNITPLEFVEGR